MKKYSRIISKIIVLIFCINIVVPIFEVSALDRLEEKNLIKNGNFNEELAGWGIWKANESFIVEIDKSESNNILKLYDNSNSSSRGKVSQSINVNGNHGKSITMEQLIKGNEFSGSLQIVAKFYDASDNYISEDVKTVQILNNNQWCLKKYVIEIPQNQSVKYVNIDYVYDGTGVIWVDDVYSQIVETEESPNLFKNNGFEEDMSYWSFWTSGDNFNVLVDSSQQHDGEVALKLHNNSTSNARGILSQRINLNFEAEKELKISQMVKSGDFSGELAIRIKYYNNSGNQLGDTEVKNIYLKGNNNWNKTEYRLNYINDNNISYAIIEYVYDGVGEIWIDDTSIIKQSKVDESNLIKNGYFNEDLNYWSIYRAKESFVTEIDEVENGNKVLKVYDSSNNNARGKISQQFSVIGNDGMAISLSQLIKSENLSGNLQVVAKFYNSNNNLISEDIKSVLISGTNSWNSKKYIIDIPNDSSVSYVNIDYVYDGTGSIFIDDVYSEIVESQKTPNLLKNSGFEEGYTYWNTWTDRGQFKAEIDTAVSKEGENSLKISSGDSQVARGAINQSIKFSNSFQNKVLNVKQWIKTENLQGEALKVRVKFQNSDGKEVATAQNIILGVKNTKDWAEEQFYIFVPKNVNIENILIEYVFDECKGSIWFDDIVINECTDSINKNIIQNGDFESIIKDSPIEWTKWYEDSDLKYSHDTNEVQNGEASLKISSSVKNKSARISQIIKWEEEYKGKTVKISQWIKSTNRNALSITIKYFNKEGIEILQRSTLSDVIESIGEWQQYKYTTMLPDSDEIEYFELEYRFKDVNGDIWIDNIVVNSLIAIESLALEPSIIELNVDEVQALKLDVNPIDADRNKFNIYIENTAIADINSNNEIIAISKGITKLIIEEELQDIRLEYPVVVSTYGDFGIDKIYNLEVVEGQSVKGKINAVSDDDLNYTVLGEAQNGYLELLKDGSFTYYAKNNCLGSDSFSVKVEDSNNVVIIQYNVKINEDLNKSFADDFIVTLSENENVSDKLIVNNTSKNKFEIEESSKNGKFSLNENGEYIYEPNKDFYGYDYVKVKITNENKQTNIIDGIIFVSPSNDRMLSNINKQYPSSLVDQSHFNSLKKLITSDNNAKTLMNKLKNEIDPILNTEVIPYNVDEGGRLNTESKEYIEKLSFMYRITGDEIYANRAWKEIENVCNYPSWNNEHFIDTAVISLGVSIGYDWLYDYLNTRQRKVVEKSITEKSLNYALKYYLKEENEGIDFTLETHNWNIVCNSSVIFSALTVINTENSEFIIKLVDNAMKSMQVALYDYYKDGGAYEGPNYWSFTTEYFIAANSILENVIGIKDIFSGQVNYNDMAKFPTYITSMSGSFNFADSADGFMPGYYNLWLAERTNNLEYTQYSKICYDNKRYLTIYDLLWFNPEIYDTNYSVDLDYLFDNIGVVSMRSSFSNKNATFVGLKGGTTGLNHGDLDIGSFVYESLGVRWAIDLGTESYNVDGYWDKEVWGDRWKHYRKRAEGHNTITIGESYNEDQIVGSTSEIIDSNLNSSNPYAILDMTSAYDNKALNITRMIQLINDRKDLVIEDEFLLKKEEEVTWQMHTDAEVEILSDGKTLLLKKDEQTLKMIISSDCSIKVEIVDVELNSDENIKKIIASVKSKQGKIKVEMIPQGEHNYIEPRIINGGFEDGLVYWNVWSGNENLKVEIDNTISKEGNNSLKIFSENGQTSRGTINQWVDVSSYYSDTIKFSQWIKSENLSSDLIGRFAFIDSSGEQIGDKIITTLLTSGTKDWEQVTSEVQIPEGTKNIVIEYLFDNSTGSIWIDTVKQVIEKGDINEDGIIDIIDLASISQKYNKSLDDGYWYIKYDINDDEIIDIYDLVYMSKKI